MIGDMLNLPLIFWIVQSVIAFLCGLNLLLDSYIDEDFKTRKKYMLLTWIGFLVIACIPIIALFLILYWAVALYRTYEEPYPPFYLKSIFSKEF